VVEVKNIRKNRPSGAEAPHFHSEALAAPFGFTQGAGLEVVPFQNQASAANILTRSFNDTLGIDDFTLTFLEQFQESVESPKCREGGAPSGLHRRKFPVLLYTISER